ncbi:F0F1 ATP synthase subunit I [Candidatus Pseudomonas adelgestsugas]|uniref:F0F1 ATP synthase subunit I n=1 Tax=Candidatus Pseudomonas adelgestsugas TaxID=1302376 RepID=A0ABX5R7D2_9PSED|nr:F0F1 ATP synthase subunit I [Candidatus Pseudomonas adelgestsugas]QAX81379.1 F0F1 ATP synthase subunit I [Candidatus Pseudomonas adelgestsugas]
MEIRTLNTLPFHRLAVFPILLAQLVVLLIAALAIWYWYGVIAGYSGLYGGLMSFLPNIYFTHRVFRFSGAIAAQSIVRLFYTSEIKKLILTAFLFTLIFVGFQPLTPLALFGVFVLTQMVIWFAPLLMKVNLAKNL